jgi:hypothetical protein
MIRASNSRTTAWQQFALALLCVTLAASWTECVPVAALPAADEAAANVDAVSQPWKAQADPTSYPFLHHHLYMGNAACAGSPIPNTYTTGSCALKGSQYYQATCTTTSWSLIEYADAACTQVANTDSGTPDVCKDESAPQFGIYNSVQVTCSTSSSVASASPSVIVYALLLVSGAVLSLRAIVNRDLF